MSKVHFCKIPFRKDNQSSIKIDNDRKIALLRRLWRTVVITLFITIAGYRLETLVNVTSYTNRRCQKRTMAWFFPQNKHDGL